MKIKKNLFELEIKKKRIWLNANTYQFVCWKALNNSIEIM